MNTQDLLNAEDGGCHFFHFGLIVTGKSERAHLPKLFRPLLETGLCTFRVIRFIGQRSPITSEKRILRMVGNGKAIPDRDATDIGLPARKHLRIGQCHAVILVDDLEQDRRPQAREVFDRYRSALDTIITDEQRHRASVHFLVNMLEAYYFADADAVNGVLELDPPLADYDGDVELIPHPKAELKQLYPSFKEVDDGGRILEHLDLRHVLSRPDTCAWLRTLFAWCLDVLAQYPLDDVASSLAKQFRLVDGVLSDVTSGQLHNQSAAPPDDAF
jgi:hypothetical protein